MRMLRRLSAIVCVALFGITTQVASAGLIVFSDSRPQVILEQGALGTLQVIPRSTAIVSNANVRLGHTKQGTSSTTANRMIVVEKVETYWVKQSQGVGRVRVTMPVRYYLAAWDVQALERELERLGVKVKPRPMPPKPGPVSG